MILFGEVRYAAVVKIAGEQVRVEKGQRVRVPKLQVEEGNSQEFTEVLLVSDEGDTKVGSPTVRGSQCLSHCRRARS